MAELSDIDKLISEMNLDEPSVNDEISFDDLESFINDLENEPSKRAVASKKPRIKRQGKYTSSGAVSGNDLENLLSLLENRVATISFTAPKGKLVKTIKGLQTYTEVIFIISKLLHMPKANCGRYCQYPWKILSSRTC